jgi:Pvc16 N-terminal domain
VIHEVDAALKSLLLTAAGAPEDLSVVFEGPNVEWVAALDGTPTISLCLYDMREEIKQRQVGQTAMRYERNRIIGWRPPPRVYRFSYIASAWSADATESRELLDWVRRCFAGMDTLPKKVLTGTLAAGRAPVPVSVSDSTTQFVPESLRALIDLPTLEIAVACQVVFPAAPAAGLVLEELSTEAEMPRVVEEARRREAGVLPVGKSWSVGVVRAGRTEAAVADARSALADLVRRLGVDPDGVEVAVTPVMTDDGPGIRLTASGTIEDGPTGAGVPRRT